jgi:hypothetical protein
MSSDPTSRAAAPPRREPRWPIALSLSLGLVLLLFMPARVGLLPAWALYAGGAAVLAPLAATALWPHNAAWLAIERTVILAFVAVAGCGNLAVLGKLIEDIVRGLHVLSGLQLLSSSIAVWATNLLMFSLLYWQLDRGGPAARAAHQTRRPDWIFPWDQAPEGALPAGWRPQFVDYLFLGFSTATAFSAADALPLTARAKLAMMAESTVSLAILVVVAARAINVLGA